MKFTGVLVALLAFAAATQFTVGLAVDEGDTVGLAVDEGDTPAGNASSLQLRASNDGEILIQQNYCGGSFFRKTWIQYKHESGNVDSYYWLGNDNLHYLTARGRYTLRVELLAKQNLHWYYAEYANFKVASEANGYVLTVGRYSGTAGDALSIVSGSKFSSYDRDQDQWVYNCANNVENGNGGGFWYTKCGHAFLNSGPVGAHGCTWYELPVGTGWGTRKLLHIRMKMLPS